jgi:hypothetical protein
MKTDLRQKDKDLIFDRANSKNITITQAGVSYPAKIYGRLLDYPVIAEAKENGLQAQINWFVAERLANGDINNINLD